MGILPKILPISNAIIIMGVQNSILVYDMVELMDVHIPNSYCI
jgi:hypothetical protein